MARSIDFKLKNHECLAVIAGHKEINSKFCCMPTVLKIGPYRFYFYSHEKGMVEENRVIFSEAWNGYFGA